MPKFNFLNSDSEFPHIGNIDVFKYDNDFDYGRFDAVQMELQICTVPWDVGEAHIGNRTISGIGNVVYFETKQKRDAWFDAIPDTECYRFTTKFKELHRALEIDVPIPYDMCAKHNYLVVRYAKFANDDSPVVYEGDDGLREWFWFIREVEFLAPNTTRLHLLDDAFQTWIYDINVSGMVLERGHAPMFATLASEYLANPVNNNDYLLTEDVNFGEASTVKHIEAVSLNDGNMYACFATTSNPQGNWGTKAGNDWKVPSQSYFTMQGQPSVYVFCMPASSLNTFLAYITGNQPQFKQTVQAVWFASDKLITLGDSFEFGNVTCYRVNAVRKTLDFITLSKTQFAYPAKYSEMAKLYTSPYAHIEVTDENGNVDIVKIEDSTGNIKLNAAMNSAYPFITIDAQLMGVGGSASKTIAFKNITSRSITVNGKWYDTVKSWNVPLFAVVLDPARENDYSTHFDRLQRANEYNTAKTNADASADTLKANADAQADTMISNADLQEACNTAVASASNASADSMTTNSNNYASSEAGAANALISANATSTITAAEQQSAISIGAGYAMGAIGAIGSAMSGDIGGVVSSAMGAVVGAETTTESMAVGNAFTAAQALTAGVANTAKVGIVSAKNNADLSAQKTATNSVRDANNTYVDGVAANNAATAKANATRERDTLKANATRDRTTAINAVANDVSQAALRAPFIYGEFANGESSTTRPMAMFAHIVTQSKSAIARAGDEFARYGYMYDGQWDFSGNWNIGKYFTYWKLRDFWVYNLNVPDMYMDKIRFFLFGGVTIWRKPEYIGKINIYDNFS